MRKRNLVTLLGIPILVITLAGCLQNYDPEKSKKSKPSFENTWISRGSINILDGYWKIETRKIRRGDRYLDFAKELQKNPELKDVRADVIAEYLRIINQGDLKYGTERNPRFVKIPVY